MDRDWIDVPLFPPAYRARPAARGAFRDACDDAARGADPGTLCWSADPGIAAAAVILHPIWPLERVWPVAYVTALAVGDALAALGPPQVEIGFGWPDRILVNGAVVGGVRVAASSCGHLVPSWLVAGFRVAMAHPSDLSEPGLMPGCTSLEEEGFGDLAAPVLIECFSRCFLGRLNQWQDEGWEPIRDAWMARAEQHDLAAGLAGAGMLDDQPMPGRLCGLTEDGLVLETARGRQTAPLAAALRSAGWTRLPLFS